MAEPHPIRLAVLGPFSLQDARGAARPVRSRKARALLAYLALSPAGRDTRERLATLLWGDTGEERARANLRHALTSLRAALGAATLGNDGDQVVLALDRVTVDARRFRALAARDDSAALEEAAALYRGPLLADVAIAEEGFEEWVGAERRRLDDLARGLLRQLAEIRVAAGDRDGAAAALERCLDVDPADEAAHRALMRVHADAGRRTAALSQFERCREVLAGRFGVAPEPRTVAVFESICAQSEAATPAPRTGDLPLPDRPSIAVLPFEDLSGESEDWFGDGIAEDVIIALSRFDALMVIARQSSFAFRGDRPDVLAVARTLGVHYVLEGSVRRAGDRVRITARLVDGGTGGALWANRYDGVAHDLFDLEDEVTATIVATLVGRIEADRALRLRRRPTASLDAYDCLLKAKALHHRHTEDANREAQACLTRAIALDPEFALAHAWMACVLAQSNTFRPDPGVFDRAYGCVQRAVALEDGESECHRILAAYHLLRRRFDEAEAHQTRALALNPNDDRIVCQMGEILTFLGRPAEAVPWIERAMRLNPFHPDGYHGDHGRALYDAGRVPEAAAAFRRIGAPQPLHHAYLAACCLRLGDRDGADRHVAALRGAVPGATAAALVGRLPYRDAAPGAQLAADLRAAGLPA